MNPRLEHSMSKTLTTTTRAACLARALSRRCLPLLAGMALQPLFATVATAAAAEITIDRQGEGRLFYSTIKLPAGAEQLLLSGIGAAPLADGSWGDMEQQTVDIFNTYKSLLEEQGWSLADIVQVRVFAVAGPDGMLDFEGFNRGYLQFFGSAANPMKPVRAFVQVAALVREGWLVEVEIQAARVPAE